MVQTCFLRPQVSCGRERGGGASLRACARAGACGGGAGRLGAWWGATGLVGLLRVTPDRPVDESF